MFADFFPNNDDNQARRMRIAKAMQYGATWVKDWHDGVTHVIMDNGLKYEELTKHLGVESLPVNLFT
jgi:DNA polymerase IV